MVTDVFRVHLVDEDKNCFLLLKHPVRVPVRLSEGVTYIADKVKLMVNVRA